MASSFLGSSAVTSLSAQSSTNIRRQRCVVKASAEKDNKKEEKSSGRRDLVFAAAAATAWSVVSAAMADEPKRGSLDAKKKYAPICVTMPTARICRNWKTMNVPSQYIYMYMLSWFVPKRWIKRLIFKHAFGHLFLDVINFLYMLPIILVVKVKVYECLQYFWKHKI